MADYTENKGTFTAVKRKLETSDPAHADLFNDLYQTLFDNDNYLKKTVEDNKSEIDKRVPDFSSSGASGANTDNFLRGDGKWASPDGGAAAKLKTPRKIKLTTDATGEASFDGSADVAIATTVSHAKAADTAGKLSTAHKIALSGDATGESTFDGSGDATIKATVSHAAAADKLVTPRTLTVGSTGKKFDGSADVSWTLKEIGAADADATQEIIDRTTCHVIPITLKADGWTGSAAPYSQTVANETLTADSNMLLVSLLDEASTADQQKAYMKTFGIVSSGVMTTAAGSVTFKVWKKPATEIVVGLRGGADPIIKDTATSGYEEMQERIASLEAARAGHWDITVAPADWGDASDEFAGITAKFKATASCVGMSANTDITGIQFTSGDRNAAATWSYLRPAAGAVELYAGEKPAGAFSLRLTEVK